MKNYRFFGVSLAVIVIDQVVKFWVHNTMRMGDIGEINVIGEFFKLHYLLNPGMAFGMQLGSDYGKLILTVIRLIAMVFIGIYLFKSTVKNMPVGFLVCIGLILGGAIGNLLDSVFYGVLLDNAPFDAPTPWFHGQVIDMFYFDIWRGYLPEWIPFFGNMHLALWPVFNIADASIFMGVLIILIFQKKYFVEPSDN